MRLRKPVRKAAHDEILPLVNVIFLLLIFFVITGVVMARPAFEITYATTAMSPAVPPAPNTLFVGRHGALFYEGRELTVEELPAVLLADEDLDRAAALPVVLDRHLAMARLAPLSEALTQAGIRRIRAVTVNARHP